MTSGGFVVTSTDFGHANMKATFPKNKASQNDPETTTDCEETTTLMLYQKHPRCNQVDVQIKCLWPNFPVTWPLL